MAPAAIAARVPEWGQGLEQAAGLLAAQRIMRRRLPAIGRPRRRQERGRADLGGVGDQRIKEESLGLLLKLVEIQAGAVEAFGQADFVTVHMASVRARGGDGSFPVSSANQQYAGTSHPRPWRAS